MLDVAAVLRKMRRWLPTSMRFASTDDTAIADTRSAKLLPNDWLAVLQLRPWFVVRHRRVPPAYSRSGCDGSRRYGMMKIVASFRPPTASVNELPPFVVRPMLMYCALT